MTLSVYLPVLLGVLLGSRCNVGILLIALVPALIAIAGVEAGLGHAFGSVVLAVVFSAFAIQAGYLAGLGVRGLYRALGLRVAAEAKTVH
jgi:hypothetical protein